MSPRFEPTNPGPARGSRVPLVIGIAGGSGSGKTTVANRVRTSLHARDVSIIEHDAYYRDRTDLSFDERSKLNFDHPDSLETELLVEQLQALRRSEPAAVPIYDFKTHRRSTEVRTVQPTHVIIVEGILVFAE